MKGLYLFAAMLTVMTVAGCGKCKKNACAAGGESVAVVVEDNVAGVVPNDFYGTYEGTLPCADCEGVKTTLKINDDTTYELRSEYLGNRGAVMEESGVYRIVGENVIELITPSSGDRTYYKIAGGAVIYSDSTGTVNEGPLADYYVLKKQ